MSLHGISLKRFFEKLHPDYRKALAKKLRTILEYTSPTLPNLPSLEKVPCLEECFPLLGIAAMRLVLIEDFMDLARKGDTTGWLLLKIKEIHELKAKCVKQRELVEELIRGHLQKLTKEY